MQLLLKIVGVLVGLFVLLNVVIFTASESGEVVVVTTQADGETHDSRLWVVDLEGDQWLRSGSDAALWYQRMLKEPQVQVTRDGATFSATVVPDVSRRDAVNKLMNEKYGMADDLIAMLFGREDAIPLKLDTGAL